MESITIKDVARICGVGVSTVSRAINNHPDINPETKEIYVCDATNYVTPGYLYCFSPAGKFQWKVRTGDIPAHIAFSTEKFY